MKTFKGTYRGLSYTNESVIGIGEIEITISDDEIKVRLATGNRVVESSIPLSDMTQMTSEEFLTLFAEAPPTHIATATVFRHARSVSGFPLFMFIKSRDCSEYGLLVQQGGLEGCLGAVALCSPEQVASGVFDKKVAVIEAQHNGQTIPRIHLDGKAG